MVKVKKNSDDLRAAEESDGVEHTLMLQCLYRESEQRTESVKSIVEGVLSSQKNGEPQLGFLR